MAHHAGFESKLIKTEFFDLTAFSKLQDSKAPVHFYIEGDGFAWASRYQLSADPTPHEPIALKLAIKDPHLNVVYLARPCQYMQTARTCDSAYWSKLRFSNEVIRSVNQAVSELNVIDRPIDLIGYSGGAAIAVLIAARRKDVRSIRTVAGNLDHDYVNSVHHVDLMPESQNAIDVASQLGLLPQIHFTGNEDEVIPNRTAERFLARLPTARCVRVVQLQANHQQGWVDQWQQLLYITPQCD